MATKRSVRKGKGRLTSPQQIYALSLSVSEIEASECSIG